MATSSLGGPPVRSAMAFDRASTARNSAPRCPTPPPTPVGALYSPNTSRSAPAHSPVVPPAWARAMVAGMMFSVPSAALRSTSRARVTARPSRAERHASTSARSSDSTAGSTLRMEPTDPAEPPCSGPSGESGDSAVSVKQLTPTTWSSPVSMRRTRSAWLRTRRDLSSSMASNAPPRARTSASSAHEASASSAVFFSMTTDPSKMSSYSKRSDSNARICWIRSDHCWSQGRGSPRASFQAGSCRARARARLDRVTPSASSTMRGTLFSGWASVRPRELTCTP